MARPSGRGRKGLEAKVTQLNTLRAAPDTPEALSALRDALGSGKAALVTVAANIAAQAELEQLCPELRAAFEPLLQDATKADPRCTAKTAVCRALYLLGERAYEVFLRGIHHRQLEPVWGGSEDTAVELRGQCALGLVRAGYPDAPIELAELLADREPMARVAAAQALAYSERTDVGLPLLWMKAKLGDADPRVTSACLGALLALAPERALPFVAGFARAEQTETREAALLALGESRLPGALAVLRAVVEDAPSSPERALAFTAIGLMRSDAGWAYLLSVVADADEGRAREALDALATYRADPALRARALEAIERRADPRLRAHAEQALRVEFDA